MTDFELPKYAQPPAHVARYVRVLGVEKTVDFLLTFGGAELYLPRNPTSRSELVKKFGITAARALGEAAELGDFPARIPIGKKWIAMVWRSKGLPVAEIARKLHTTDKTVRSWFKQVDARHDTRQGTLI